MKIDFEEFDRGMSNQNLTMKNLKKAGYNDFKFVTEAFYMLYDNGKGMSSMDIGLVTGHRPNSVIYHLRKMGADIAPVGGKREVKIKNWRDIYREYQGAPKKCEFCESGLVKIGQWSTCDKCLGKKDHKSDDNPAGEFSCGGMISS